MRSLTSRYVPDILRCHFTLNCTTQVNRLHKLKLDIGEVDSGLMTLKDVNLFHGFLSIIPILKLHLDHQIHLSPIK